ncbi:hypothetical protein ACQY0O_001572 [Thecaphora frezii]
MRTNMVQGASPFDWADSERSLPTYHFNDKALALLLMPRWDPSWSSDTFSLDLHWAGRHAELDSYGRRGLMPSSCPPLASKVASISSASCSNYNLGSCPAAKSLARLLRKTLHVPRFAGHRRPSGHLEPIPVRQLFAPELEHAETWRGLYCSRNRSPSPALSTSSGSLSDSSSSCSSGSSPGSSRLKFDPDQDVELELAISMAPPELKSAWASKSYEASSYLRARTPYPKAVVDAIFAFHEQRRNSRSRDRNSVRGGSGRWGYALDLGCGPGQMALHLATRFDRVLGQDVSERMIELATVAKQLDAHELAQSGLPSVEDPLRIQYNVACGEDPIVPAGVQLDVITMGACFHWMDTSTLEKSRTVWHRWSSVLRPGGSLFIFGMRPVVGPYTGQMGERLRPLREWLLSFWRVTPGLRRYYDLERIDRAYGPEGLFSGAAMPWDLSDERLARLWERQRYAYVPIDDPVSGKLICSDPGWLPDSVRRAIRSDNSRGELSVSVTTPRRQAEWVRSTSGYAKMLREDTEQRVKAIADEDIAAVTIRQICADIGIGYEDEIECHSAGVLICLRRSGVVYGIDD